MMVQLPGEISCQNHSPFIHSFIHSVIHHLCPVELNLNTHKPIEIKRPYNNSCSFLSISLFSTLCMGCTPCLNRTGAALFDSLDVFLHYLPIPILSAMFFSPFSDFLFKIHTRLFKLLLTAQIDFLPAWAFIWSISAEQRLIGFFYKENVSTMQRNGFTGQKPSLFPNLTISHLFMTALGPCVRKQVLF